MLFGGCLNKRMPRKDIDIVVKKEEGISYRDYSVDWWFYDFDKKSAENLYRIIVEIPEFESSQFIKSSGLYLPYLENVKKKIVKALYLANQ